VLCMCGCSCSVLLSAGSGFMSACDSEVLLSVCLRMAPAQAGVSAFVTSSLASYRGVAAPPYIRFGTSNQVGAGRVHFASCLRLSSCEGLA
jgi:hypothetical protein